MLIILEQKKFVSKGGRWYDLSDGEGKCDLSKVEWEGKYDQAASQTTPLATTASSEKDRILLGM